MPAGRPSKYKPAFCDHVVELGKEGKSITYMAGTLGVDVHTLDNWAKDNEEFFTAFNTAKVQSQMWWEDKGQVGIEKSSSEFQGNLWGRNMSARFPADWRESKDLNLGGGVKVVSMNETDERL